MTRVIVRSHTVSDSSAMPSILRSVALVLDGRISVRADDISSSGSRWALGPRNGEQERTLFQCFDVVYHATICVLAFIKTRMIRKSGYFASVLELRPVSRCHESPRRSCSSSSRKSNCSRGSANCGSLFRTLLPSPEWQASVFAAMVNIFVLNSLSSLKPHTFPWERLPHRQVEMVSADILLCSTTRVPHQFQPIELQNANIQEIQVSTLPSVRFISFATFPSLKPRPTKR